MSDKPITLQMLREMLRQLDEIPNIAWPSIATPRSQRPREETLASLMDRYDLSDRIAGRESGARRSISYPSDYGSTESGLLIREMPNSWNFTAPQPQYWSYVYGFNGVDESGAETEERRKRLEEEERRKEMEKRLRCNTFAQQVDSLSTKSAITLRNPDPQPTMPDYIETLTGWRVWHVSHGKLESLGVNEWWTPRHAVPARCNRSSSLFNHPHGGEPSPHNECTCGYWSFKSKDALMDVAGDYDGIAVIGTVEIWGKVIECENGYRSEFAYPKELWLLKPDLDYLSWTYGVPVRKMTQ